MQLTGLEQTDTESLVAVKEEKRILIVEDDPDIAELIRIHLQEIYQHISVAHNGLKGYSLAQTQQFDLVVLDLRLPGKDGLAFCRDLRGSNNNVPIIMLTSKSSELDRVLGLEMGADDYVTKPFSIIELSARIKAIFRRTSDPDKPEANTKLLQIKEHGLSVDLVRHKVTKYDTELELTAKEFELLAYFMSNPDTVFSRLNLLNQVWGYGHDGYEHTVNTHINRLRAKIENKPTEPTIITTVWGVGYKLKVAH